MKKNPLHVEPKYNLEINQTAFQCLRRLGRFDSALTVLLITVFYQEFHSDPVTGTKTICLNLCQLG